MEKHSPLSICKEDAEWLGNQQFKQLFFKKKILRCLYKESAKTISEIGKCLQASIPTATKLLQELVAEGWVEEQGLTQSKGGRRANSFGIKADAAFVMGVFVQRKNLEFAIFNLRNEQVVKLTRVPFVLRNTQDSLKQLISEINTFLQNAGIDLIKLVGIGIATPGLVNSVKGFSYSYFTTSENSLKQRLEKEFNCPVFIENDARAMALGELIFGAAMGKENVLCINMSSGLGLGIITNGRLHYGRSGFAGEFGHINIVPDGALCHCGKRGCLETVASGAALEKVVLEKLKKGNISSLTSLYKENPSEISIDRILEAACHEDMLAIDAITNIGNNLGQGIAILINLFNPELLIIGGKFARANKYIIDPVRQALNKYSLSKLSDDTQVVTSQLGDEAGLYGVIALVIESIFEDVS